MAKLNGIARKLQKAILRKGLVIRMGTSQFYSVEQKRLITVYILSTRIMERKKNGEWKDTDLEILRTASLLEIVNCLNDIWKTVKEQEHDIEPNTCRC
jgi:hypothetical protein